jgi:hypothetical protein
VATKQESDCKRIFGLMWLERSAPGHDGIRASGSQSLTSASKATIVIGFPLAGPTCSAITSIPVQSRVSD